MKRFLPKFALIGAMSLPLAAVTVSCEGLSDVFDEISDALDEDDDDLDEFFDDVEDIFD